MRCFSDALDLSYRGLQNELSYPEFYVTSRLFCRDGSIHAPLIVGRARFYRKLARKQQLLWFGQIDATAHPELAHELGMKAVPAFVTFRGGELVTSATTSKKKKIEQLVEELLLE